MSFRRLSGLVTLSLAFAVHAPHASAQQDTATGPAAQAATDAAEAATQPASEAAPAAATEGAAAVTPVPEQAPAAAVALTDAHGPAEPGDAERGSAKAAVCAACHGMDGNSADPMYPKLAGQQERYVARQLALFKTGERDNPIMMGFAAPLSPQDMRDLGAFYAKQVVVPGVADETPIAEGSAAGSPFYSIGAQLYRGGNLERNIPACLACHGPSGAGNPGPAYAQLGGQHARYTADMLTRYRAGTVYGEGPQAGVMAGVAKYLTDQEIQSLATYIEGLHAVDTGAIPGTGTTAAR